MYPRNIFTTSVVLITLIIVLNIPSLADLLTEADDYYSSDYYIHGMDIYTVTADIYRDIILIGSTSAPYVTNAWYAINSGNGTFPNAMFFMQSISGNSGEIEFGHLRGLPVKDLALGIQCNEQIRTYLSSNGTLLQYQTIDNYGSTTLSWGKVND